MTLQDKCKQCGHDKAIHVKNHCGFCGDVCN